MAPRMSRDYYSTVEPNSYSLRTTVTRGEDNFLQWNGVDVSRTTAKEDFFRSMGLQMKRYQPEYKMLNGSHRTRKINIPDGVKLRDCSVVILGSTCKTCSKRFKCATDLIVHNTFRHGKYQGDDKVVAGRHTVVYDDKDKFQRELDEMFSRMSADTEISVIGSRTTKLPKYLTLTLKVGAEVIVRRAIKRKHLTKRRKSNISTQTEVTHNGDELIMGKGEGAVPRIDLPALDNSPCQCCNSGLHVVNSTNQYLAGNIVTSKDTKYEEHATKDGFTLDRLTESCAARVDGKDVVLHARMSHSSPATYSDDTKDCDSDGMSFLDATDIPCYEDIGVTLNSTNDSSETSDDSGIVNTVIVPVILPIIVSNNNNNNVSEDKRGKSSEQRSPTGSWNGESEPKENNVEKNNDDEIQEVLRIVRGQGIIQEINHESPNRNEQEMLVRNAINDLIRLQERDWQHLLEERAPKKLRVSGEFDANRKRGTIPLNAEDNVNKGAKEKHVSNAKELAADNTKENLMYNRNVYISPEVLRCYGINYYNDTCEINNNVQTVQEPVGCFLGSCSGGMENRSNKPTIIDLVNDTDE